MRTAETDISITLGAYLAWERFYIRSPDNHHVAQMADACHNYVTLSTLLIWPTDSTVHIL